MQDVGHTSPRIGTSQLASFVNKRVLFVGRVETQTQGIAQMVGPDGGRVTVQLQAPMEAQIVEVEGTVVDGQTIREDSHVHFNDNFGGWAGRTVAGRGPSPAWSPRAAALRAGHCRACGAMQLGQTPLRPHRGSAAPLPPLQT